MAEKIKDVIRWLSRLEDPEGFVGVDDGGLTLETSNGSLYEIGGIPEEGWESLEEG